MTWVFSFLLSIYIGAIVGMALGLFAVYLRDDEPPPWAIVVYLLLALMGAIVGGMAWVMMRP